MGVDESLEELRRTLSRLLKDAFDQRQGVFGEPLVYGLTVRPTREIKADVSRVAAPISAEHDRIPVREPLTDIVDLGQHICVTAEMHDVDATQVRVRMEGSRLIIEGRGERRYLKILDLPEDVTFEGMTSTYKNGVLDVVFKKRSVAEVR